MVLMEWHKATKQQLLQISLNEECPIDFKYRACYELQMRWNSNMLTDVVLMYGKGYTVKEIAEYLGIGYETVSGVVSKYKLRRASCGLAKNAGNAESIG